MNNKEKPNQLISNILKINLNKFLGIILILPAIFSVIILLIAPKIFYPHLNNTIWTGFSIIKDTNGIVSDKVYNYNDSHYYGIAGAGYTSALPIYIGLLAIAGAILKSTNNQK